MHGYTVGEARRNVQGDEGTSTILVIEHGEEEAGGEMGASPSIRRPMLASVAEAKKPSRGILQWLAPSLIRRAGRRNQKSFLD